jgi:hypothetical protein
MPFSTTSTTSVYFQNRFFTTITILATGYVSNPLFYTENIDHFFSILLGFFPSIYRRWFIEEGRIEKKRCTGLGGIKGGGRKKEEGRRRDGGGGGGPSGGPAAAGGAISRSTRGRDAHALRTCIGPQAVLVLGNRLYANLLMKNRGW